MTDTTASLAGKTVLVSGASSGIGRAIAIEAARSGADVVLTWRSNESGAREAAAEAGAMGRQATLVQLDVSEEASVASLVSRLARDSRRIDAWINNAGADILTGGAERLSRDAKLDLVLAVDVRGTVRMSWAAVEHMRSGPPGGAILNVSWDHVDRGMAGENPIIYSTAKGAVASFSRSLALEVAPHIRVNVLAPGFIETAFGEGASTDWREHVRRITPLKRWGTPEDVAQVAVYLASDRAGYVTGQTVKINGGVVV